MSAVQAAGAVQVAPTQFRLEAQLVSMLHAAGAVQVAPLHSLLTPQLVSIAHVLLVVQVAPLQTPPVPQPVSMLHAEPTTQRPATQALPPQLALLEQVPPTLQVPFTEPFAPVPQALLSQSAAL